MSIVRARHAAVLALSALALMIAGCGVDAENAAGRGQGLGGAEVCICALVLVLLTVPVGVLLLVLRLNRAGAAKAATASSPAAATRSSTGLRIFISYRRSDSQDATGRIYDALVARFSRECVFKDVDSIPLGQDFRKVLQEAVTRASVVIVVMGPGWYNARDTAGRRRLDDPDDFVRIEIETALAQGVPMIPVMVSNAKMVTAPALPESLKPLAFQNGLAVRPDPDFHRDIGRLAGAIERIVPGGGSQPASQSSAKPPPPPKVRAPARPWLWLLLGGLGLPLLGFALLCGGAAWFSHFERQQLRAGMFTNLLEMNIPEADVAGSGTLPKILARFNPKAPGKQVRVQLDFNQPYEFPATEGATEPGPLGKHGVFEPAAELRIVRDDTAAVVGQTSTVEWQYVPSMGVSVSEGMQKGIPSQMVVEFEPTDTSSYRIEFKAPEKGFQRYRLLIQQQGL